MTCKKVLMLPIDIYIYTASSDSLFASYAEKSVNTFELI